MRMRFSSLEAITSTNDATSTAPLSRNMRPLTPPRNRTPIEIIAITMNAPMSGSRSSRKPVKPSATAIGQTARMKSSFTSILRVM